MVCKPDFDPNDPLDFCVNLDYLYELVRDEPELYLPIQQAQEELTAACDDIIMVSRRFKTFAAKGLMKDRFHYMQPANTEVGEEAGRSVAAYWNR